MTNRTSIYATIFLSACSFLAYSQSSDTLKAKRVTITTSLTELLPTFGLSTHNFNVGAETYLGNRKSLYTSIGYIKSFGPTAGWVNISTLGTQGFKFQTELRHYFNKRKIVEPAILLFWPHIFQYHTQEVQNAGYYVALHSSYQWTETERQETVVDYIDDYPIPNTSHYRKNNYSVNRNAFGLNILFGYQCIKKRGLVVDYCVGFGGQFISSYSTNRIGTDTDWPNSETEFYNTIFDHGTGFAPYLIYRVRLGWAL